MKCWHWKISMIRHHHISHLPMTICTMASIWIPTPTHQCALIKQSVAHAIWTAATIHNSNCHRQHVNDQHQHHSYQPKPLHWPLQVARRPNSIIATFAWAARMLKIWRMKHCRYIANSAITIPVSKRHIPLFLLNTIKLIDDKMHLAYLADCKSSCS